MAWLDAEREEWVERSNGERGCGWKKIERGGGREGGRQKEKGRETKGGMGLKMFERYTGK